MAWQDEAIPMLRVLINDNDITNLTYSDDRLEEILVVAAMYVNQDVSFSTTYTINVSTVSISPDPVTNSDFLSLMVMRAACLTDWGTYRQKALLAGVKARCGPAVLETMNHLDGFKELLTKGPCASYEVLKTQHQFGNTEHIRAVLSPFRGNNFDPTDYLYPDRRKY